MLTDEKKPMYKPCMIYPEFKWKTHWDLFITVILIFTCISTPFRIAFTETDALGWLIVNYTIDSLFFVDIVLIFNSAYQDEDFRIVDDRKQIAKVYLKGWFMVDILAIVPFDLIFQGTGSGMNDMVKIARIGRMYKLIKLTKLLRILKIVKERSKLLKYVQELLKIGVGFERLFFFILIFILLCHIVSCLWVFTASFSQEEDYEGTWRAGDFTDELIDTSGLYMKSFYFTV